MTFWPRPRGRRGAGGPNARRVAVVLPAVPVRPNVGPSGRAAVPSESVEGVGMQERGLPAVPSRPCIRLPQPPLIRTADRSAAAWIAPQLAARPLIALINYGLERWDGLQPLQSLQTQLPTRCCHVCPR